jgi:hypothetical protein
VEATPGFDGSADDHELGAVVVGHLRELDAEGALARAYDLPPHRDTVGLCDRCRVIELLLQLVELAPEMRVERELLIDHEERYEHDARTAVRGEATSEIQSMLRLGPAEERNHDVPVADGRRSARETPQPPAGDAETCGQLHRRIW